LSLTGNLSFGSKLRNSIKEEELDTITPEDLRKKINEKHSDQQHQEVELHLKDRNGACTPEEEEDDKRERMRIEVINEIIISERYYVRDLETVVNLFLIPLRNLQIVSTEDIKKLFSNIELIFTVNQEITSNFQRELIATPEIQLFNIGQIFLKTVQFLKVYSIYSSNYATAIATYDHLKTENKEFLSFLQENEIKQECKGINLMGYLIKPVQKICKYPLIFKELLKQTPPRHPDYDNILQCYKKVEEIADYVNEKKRASENTQKMLEISEHLTDVPKQFSLLVPTRTFIREGVVGKVNENGKMQERYFFLFNDILIYTKTQMFKKLRTSTKVIFLWIVAY